AGMRVLPKDEQAGMRVLPNPLIRYLSADRPKPTTSVYATRLYPTGIIPLRFQVGPRKRG
ncbi:MAG: hypothetical protein ACPGWR_34190, partial [Ardenticatenaceae bacterium]